jgi:F-box protein 9
MSSSSTLPSTPLHSDTSTPITLEEMLSHLNLTSEKAQGEAKPDAVDANEDEELERFRSEWRREVQSKRQPVAPASHHDEPTHHSQILDGTKRSTSPSKGRIKPKSPVISLGLLNDEKDLTRLGTDPIPAKSLITSAPPVEAAVKVKVALDPQLEALQIYGRAVEAEQSGRLGEAVMQYRKASKIDGEFLVRQWMFAGCELWVEE